jgi:hypothetical protein
MRFIDTADVTHELIHAVLHNTTKKKKKDSINRSKSSVKGEARSAETSKNVCSLPPKVLQTVLAISPARNPVPDKKDEQHSN